jgi:cytochrome c553
MRHTLLAVLFVALAGASFSPPLAAAQPVEETAAVCSGCHGKNGVPVDKSIPVIWGQNEGYLYLQLRDFKPGNRKSEVMNQICSGLEKPDMHELAAYFAAKPWPNLGQPRAAAEAVHRSLVIDGSAACRGCHLGDWQGASVTPRLAGQNLQYLRETMVQFRDGERSNNPWMTALLKTYNDADIDALANYLAGY